MVRNRAQRPHCRPAGRRGDILRKLLLLGLALGVGLNAAPASGQELVLGAKGGVNIADVDTDTPDIGETDARTAFQAGAFLTIGIGDYFAVQPEVFYAQKGTGFTEDGVDVDLKLDYFEVPLLIKAVLGAEGSLVHFAPYVGGALAFESKCEAEGSEGGVEVTLDRDAPEFDIERETTDYGLLFGAEILLDVGDQLLVLLDGRYNLGLRNLEAGDSVDGVSTKNRVFSIMAGVGIRLN